MIERTSFYIHVEVNLYVIGGSVYIGLARIWIEWGTFSLGCQNKTKLCPLPIPYSIRIYRSRHPETRLVFRYFVCLFVSLDSLRLHRFFCVRGQKGSPESFVFLSQKSSCTYPAMSESRYVECFVACLR